jgi:hypothetical protein
MKYFRKYKGVMRDEQGNWIKEDVEYIKRETDKALIPCVEGNADYQAYLEDKEKVVEDFDYEAEDLRQQTASAGKREADDMEALISERMRKNAEAELIKEGVIDDRDNN